MDLDLQGNIERFTLPEILQLIASSRKSGTLGIQKDESIVMVYFKQGNIIYGYGPRQTFHLGQLLKDRGVISARQLDDAIRIQAQTENSKRLGEILVTRGFIDRADLQAVVRRQVEELLFSLLAWTSGSFKFYEDQFPTDEEITVALSVENVILEGLRRLDELNLVTETLPDPEAVYTISAAQGGRTRDVALEATEWNIMALVDGHRTLTEVARLAPLPDNEAMKKIAQLKLAGLITKTEKRKEESTGNLEMMVNRLAGLFEEYITEKSNNRLADRRISRTILEQVD